LIQHDEHVTCVRLARNRELLKNYFAGEVIPSIREATPAPEWFFRYNAIGDNEGRRGQLTEIERIEVAEKMANLRRGGDYGNQYTGSRAVGGQSGAWKSLRAHGSIQSALAAPGAQIQTQGVRSTTHMSPSALPLDGNMS
jgi:hypothetical protein